MRLITQFVAVVSCIFLTSLAQATQFNYAFAIHVENIYEFTNFDLTGTPTSTAFPIGGQINVGDTLNGIFSFDQEKLDLPPASQLPTSRYFTDFNGGAHSFSFSTPGGISYSSATSDQGVLQLEDGSFDYFSIVNFGAELTTGLALANWNGGVFQSLDLPSDIKLSDFTYTWFRTSWTTLEGKQIAVDGIVKAIKAIPNVNEVPEPASWTMFILGFAGLCFVRGAARK